MAIATTTDGIDVRYDDLGGRGVDALFAHATGFHGHVWLPVVAALEDAVHAVVFDQRGHGDTPAAAGGVFDWNGFARDALAVVDEADLDRPLGIGHSAGGAALLLAELARPGTFRALYCFEPIVPPPSSAGTLGRSNPLAEGARRRREVFPSRDAAYENYASKPPLAGFAPQALRAYVDHGFADLPDGSVRLKCRPEHEARTYEMSTRHGMFDRLGEIRCPVTVASGELDVALGQDTMRAVAAALPAGRYEVLRGLGHFAPMEAPETVAASVRRTLEALRSA